MNPFDENVQDYEVTVEPQAINVYYLVQPNPFVDITVTIVRNMIKKLISGGQTGADQAGLDAAIALSIPTGGTAPQGWLIQDYEGNNIPCPELATKYGLVECDEPGYPPRTKRNVLNSDGTLWVGFTDSSGGRLTIGTAKKLGKKLIVNPSAEELRDWIEQHHIQTLNVAGNRYSEFNPDIYEQTYTLLIDALRSDRPTLPQ